MSHYNGIGRVYGPEYFVLADESGDEPAPYGLRQVPMLALELGHLLPVFTSAESAQDFVETYYTEENQARVGIGNIGAFTLAGMCKEAEKANFRALVFDPVATEIGCWTDPQGTVSISYYSRFAAELDSGLDKLAAEAEAELGHKPESAEDLSQIRAWCEVRIEETVEDAHARAAEWVFKDEALPER